MFTSPHVKMDIPELEKITEKSERFFIVREEQGTGSWEPIMYQDSQRQDPQQQGPRPIIPMQGRPAGMMLAAKVRQNSTVPKKVHSDCTGPRSR